MKIIAIQKRLQKASLLLTLALGAALFFPGVRVTAQSLQPVTGQATVPGPVTEGLQMTTTILSTHSSPKATDIFILDIAVKNVISKEAGLYETGLEVNEFHVQVKDSKGVQVPLTAFGKKTVFTGKRQIYRLNMMILLEPGQTKHFYVWLNRSYDLSLDGRYSVDAKCDVARLDDKGSATMVSNTASFDILRTMEADVIDSLLKK